MKEKLEKLKAYIDLALDFIAFKKAKDTVEGNSTTSSIVSKIKNIFKK